MARTRRAALVIEDVLAGRRVERSPTVAEQIVLELRNAGWHLVSTPEMEWHEDAPDGQREYRYSVIVDNVLLDARKLVSRLTLTHLRDVEGYLKHVVEQIRHQVANALLLELESP